MARNYSIEGFFTWASGFVPQNLNPKMWLVDVFDVLGGPQTFDDIQDLIDFHPLKMKKGQTFTITDFPNGGVNTVFILNTNPSLLLDGNEETLVTLDNYRNYYDQQSSTITSKDIVYQYAPNYLGGQPLFPYTSDNALRNERDGVWHAIQNKTTGDRWFRTRDNDDFTMYTDPDAGPDIKVYDNWTRPLPFGAVFDPGDYINNRFKREVQGTTGITLAANLVLNDFYLVVAGLVTATRVSDGVDFLHGEGGTFEATSLFTYVFTDAGTTVDTIPDIPTRTDAQGFPNNEPSGWTDAIPSGTVQLWKIIAHKSVYGQLKSEWIIEKIIESPELLRYSRKSTPHPDTLVGVNDSIVDLYGGSNPPYIGLTFDEILDLEGWQSAYIEGETDFIATRADDGGSPPWTTWTINKISDESGEYTDYVYKLLSINISAANLLTETPVAADPSSEGFHDGPQIETDTLINYVSRARKFFDGTLKTDWSDLVPFTGADLYASAIILPDGNDFKFAPNSPTPTIPVPIELRMQAQLHKGLSELWKDPANTLAFKWEITFDNGAAVGPPATEIVSNNKADDAYLKLATPISATGTITSVGTAVSGSGTLFTSEFNAGEWLEIASGQIRQIASISDNTNLVLVIAFSPDISVGEDILNSYLTTDEAAEGYRDSQILVINHAYITGKAFFQLTITLTTAEGDITFIRIIDILDITDGLDRKALEIGTSGQLTLYDTVAEALVPIQVLMHAMFSNLPLVSQFYWYFNNGAGYTIIDGTETNYGLSGAKDEVLTIDLQSDPVAKSGTVTTTGTAVLGSGTLFSTEFVVGSYISVNSGQIRKIVTITDSLNIVVDIAFSPNVAAESISRIDCLVDRDQTAQELQIAVSTHPSDPTLADGINNLSDYSTIAKSSTAGVGTDGDDPPVSILTQESYTAVLDAITKLPLAGELGTGGNVQSDIIVYKGETRLDYTAGDFTVVAADPTGITTEAIRISPTDSENANVWVDVGGWVANTRTGIIKLTITTSAAFGSLVMTKEFSLASTLDSPGAILLDIDSNSGFSFDRKPGGLINKTLTARLYDVVSGVQTELDPADYYYQWEGPAPRTWTAGAGGTNGEVSPQISKASIFADAVVICKVSESVTGSPILRQVSVRITDITDSKTYRLYSSEVSEPAKPIDTIDPEATQGVWAKSTVGAIWASDGTEKIDASNPPFYEFSQPYQITGEQGDQGESGGFMLAMYQNFTTGSPGTVPSSTATLAQMEVDGWTYKPPTVSAGAYLWFVQRPFDAFSAPAVPVVFDGNGKPDTNPISGSLWIGPVQVSGFDGINGDFFEFRYQKNTSNTAAPTLATGSRNPSGWTLAQPSRSAGEFVWITKALINGDTNALIGVWGVAILSSGYQGDQGIQGKGFTGGSYNAGTGAVTFSSADGLGFTTGDLRGSDAPGPALVAQVDNFNQTLNIFISDGATWTVERISTGTYAFKRNGGSVGSSSAFITPKWTTSAKHWDYTELGQVRLYNSSDVYVNSDFSIAIYL